MGEPKPIPLLKPLRLSQNPSLFPRLKPPHPSQNPNLLLFSSPNPRRYPMAAKRKAPALPPESSSSEEVESSDEEQEEVTNPSALKPNNSAKSAEPISDSESESEAELEPETEPKSQTTPKKPAESDESSSSSEEDEEEKEEEEEKEPASKPKDPVKKPGAEPEKKRLKAAASPSQSTGKFKSRIWSPDDETVLLQALSVFHSKNNRIPAPKEFHSFFNSMNGKLNGAITVIQVRNKVRCLRDAYKAKKKRGTEPAPSNPHAKVIFEVSEKLWGGKNKVPMNEEEPSQDASDDEVSSGEAAQKTENNGTVNNGDIANDGTVNGGTINGDAKMKGECQNPYLIEAFEELRKANPGMFLFFKRSFESLDEENARDFEARFKKLKYNEAKLSLDKMKIVTQLAKTLTKLGK